MANNLSTLISRMHFLGVLFYQHLSFILRRPYFYYYDRSQLGCDTQCGERRGCETRSYMFVACNMRFVYSLNGVMTVLFGCLRWITAVNVDVKVILNLYKYIVCFSGE